MNELPFVTVIIPALNEEQVIGACLRALAEQTYPRDRFEVVVVDNGSQDRTADVSRETGATVLHESRPSAYVARNAAIRATTGDYLAFTDADCVPVPEWIEELVKEEARAGTGVVAGHIDYQMSFDSLGNRMLIASRSRDVIREFVCVHRCAPTGNVMIRRRLLEQHGLFCETAYGSDIAMSKRLAGLGHPPVFAPAAVVVHQCDLPSREYLARTFWNSRGNALHDSSPATVRRFFREAAQFPWRPGFRSVRMVQQAVSDRPPSGFVRTWLYMLMQRFAGYTGRVSGTAARVWRRDRRPTGAALPPRPAVMPADEVAQQTSST